MSGARQCVILVGGKGTRLGALTKDTPKPLLPVGGRPFLSYLIQEAARHGQRVRLVDHMRKTDVLCEVTDPVFLDPEGAKLRA